MKASSPRCAVPLLLPILTLCLAHSGRATTTAHQLSGGNFSQSWSSAGLITANDDWSGVPSIVGYRGDGGLGSGVDPQTVVADSFSTVVDVIANQTNPNTLTTGGVSEFDTLTDPVVGFQGSGTADAPNLVIYLDSTGMQAVRVQYNLRDIDGSADDAIQPVALQYRIGTVGDFLNVPAAFIADATTGPGLSSLVTAIDVTLPTDADNVSDLQVRILTTNAVGNDEWVGIDDISISATVIPEPASLILALAGFLPTLRRRR
ncbi:MAG: hypothetical protein KA004_07100 [Verrucomicrobiales bacterium]|nr:hypothetical protein [Verrucomicrobiales bacterium]